MRATVAFSKSFKKLLTNPFRFDKLYFADEREKSSGEILSKKVKKVVDKRLNI